MKINKDKYIQRNEKSREGSRENKNFTLWHFFPLNVSKYSMLEIPLFTFMYVKFQQKQQIITIIYKVYKSIKMPLYS